MIPYSGAYIPRPEDITLIGPKGQIELKLDESLSGGNETSLSRILAKRKYIYISVTDPYYIEDGIWTVSSLSDLVAIEDFEVNAVDSIPELTAVNVGPRADNEQEIWM